MLQQYQAREEDFIITAKTLWNGQQLLPQIPIEKLHKYISIIYKEDYETMIQIMFDDSDHTIQQFACQIMSQIDLQNALKKVISDSFHQIEYECPKCDRLINNDLIRKLEYNQTSLEHSQIKQVHQKEQQQLLDVALELCNGDKDQAQQIIMIKQNYFEIGAVTQLKPDQRKALKTIAQTAKKESDIAYPKVLKLIKNLGYSESDFQKILQYIRDDAPITVNFKLSLLPFFLKDGYMKNVFEVNIRGEQYNQKRKFIESQIFLLQYDNSENRDRPKYGALNIFNNSGGIQTCTGYGESFFILKEVRLRTTFYDKDTFLYQNELNLGTCQHYSHLLLSYTEQDLKQLFNIIIGKNKMEYESSTYKEVQIHGDILFNKHIECMVYDQNVANSDPEILQNINKFSKKYGVQCIPNNKENK